MTGSSRYFAESASKLIFLLWLFSATGYVSHFDVYKSKCLSFKLISITIPTPSLFYWTETSA